MTKNIAQLLKFDSNLLYLIRKLKINVNSIANNLLYSIIYTAGAYIKFCRLPQDNLVTVRFTVVKNNSIVLTSCE